LIDNVLLLTIRSPVTIEKNMRYSL
jgi:hypothetical protein